MPKRKNRKSQLTETLQWLSTTKRKKKEVLRLTKVIQQALPKMNKKMTMKKIKRQTIRKKKKKKKKKNWMEMVIK